MLTGFGQPLSLLGANEPPGDLFRTYDAAADAAQSAFDLAERLAVRDPQVKQLGCLPELCWSSNVDVAKTSLFRSRSI